MDFSKKMSEFVGQSLAKIAIGGVVTIMVVGAVISALLTANIIQDVAILALIGIVTLIVTVVVISQIASYI